MLCLTQKGPSRLAAGLCAARTRIARRCAHHAAWRASTGRSHDRHDRRFSLETCLTEHVSYFMYMLYLSYWSVSSSDGDRQWFMGNQMPSSGCTVSSDRL